MNAPFSALAPWIAVWVLNDHGAMSFSESVDLIGFLLSTLNVAWDAFVMAGKRLSLSGNFLKLEQPDGFRRGEPEQPELDVRHLRRARTILENSALQTNPSTGEPFLYKEPVSDSYFALYTHMPQLKDCRKIVIDRMKPGSSIMSAVSSWARSRTRSISRRICTSRTPVP